MLTLAEKQWLQAALSLMGLATVGGGIGNASRAGEDEEDAVSVDLVDDEGAMDVVVAVALASVSERVSHQECSIHTPAERS